jgi:hypothetical protein
VRFGRWTKLWEPGFHLRIPFFDEVRVVNTRLNVATAPSQTLTTLDGRLLTVAAAVGFRIADPVKAMMLVRDPASVCAAIAQGEFAAYIAQRRLDEVRPMELELAVLSALSTFGGTAIVFEFIRLVDFAACRTIRLLQDSWRPNSGHEDKL